MGRSTTALLVVSSSLIGWGFCTLYTSQNKADAMLIFIFSWVLSMTGILVQKGEK